MWMWLQEVIETRNRDIHMQSLVIIECENKSFEFFMNHNSELFYRSSSNTNSVFVASLP